MSMSDLGSSTEFGFSPRYSFFGISHFPMPVIVPNSLVFIHTTKVAGFLLGVYCPVLLRACLQAKRCKEKTTTHFSSKYRLPLPPVFACIWFFSSAFRKFFVLLIFKRSISSRVCNCYSVVWTDSIYSSTLEIEPSMVAFFFLNFKFYRMKCSHSIRDSFFIYCFS